MNKTVVAKEWLYFLGCLLFGLVVFPFLLFIVFGLLNPTDITVFYSRFYSGLLGGHDALITWVVVFIPYLLFQVVRSVIWAWKTTRRPK